MNLAHYLEFQELLSKYKVSEHAATVLKELKLVLLTGVTSSGRNTIIRHQLQTGLYHYIISDTTRPPRINDGVLEQNGREYWFRPEGDILADIKAGEYLEAELIHDQQVSGISIRELEVARQDKKIAITDVDLAGIHNIVRVKPDTVAVMLLPPSFEEWQKRLTGRGKMSVQEQKNRLQTAQKVFLDGVNQEFYSFIIAENIEQSGEIIDSLAVGGINPHQDRGQVLVRQLLNDLQSYIASNIN